MNRNRRNPHPADRPLRAPASLGTIVRRTLWVVGPLAMATLVARVLALAGAGSDWVAFICLVAVLWAISASLIQALWQGMRHGDWSEFSYCELPRNDEDFDFTTESGTYAYRRIQRQHESLMRDGDQLIENHDHHLVP